MFDPSPMSLMASVREALAAARTVRTPEELHAALEQIAQTISATLGYGTVDVHLHRLAWNDFVATTRSTAQGRPSHWEQWTPYLAAGFERRGAHHVPAGSSTDPTTWDPDDRLLVVLRRTNGDVLGLISVDEPASGRRPTDEELDRLVALGQFAALAVEQAEEAARDIRRRVTLERLLAISSRIAGRGSRGGVLDEVCLAVRDALGFQRVAVMLSENGGLLRPAATVGWSLHDPVFAHAAFTIGQLQPILQPANERHGCYLLEREDAEAALGVRTAGDPAERDGLGPYAWQRHWLIVPLLGADGEPHGVLWVDDPADRLLPGREQLQTLRLFAHHAAAALQPVGDDQLAPHQADHDPLTGLANRPTLTARLRHALQRVKRADGTLAVLFIDLDNFKQANDALGHAAGDELLRVSAARLDEAIRPGDTVARFGGDEFVALCEDVAGPDEAMDIAERLRVILAEPIPLATGVAHVTASLGVALPDRPDRSAEMLLQAADRAMYEAKAAGRDAARLGTPGAGWP